MKGRNLRGTTLIPAINHMQALSCVTCILRRGLHLMDSSARLMREIRVLQGTERNLQPVIPSLCQNLKPLLCAVIAFSCKSFMILAYEFKMSSGKLPCRDIPCISLKQNISLVPLTYGTIFWEHFVIIPAGSSTLVTE